MFAWWGGVVVRLRWLIVGLSIGVAAIGATWGASVVDSLSDGGFYPEDGPSAVANERIEAEFGRQHNDVVVLYSSDEYTVTDPRFAGPVTDLLAGLRGRPEIAGVTSFFDSPDPSLVAEDGQATVVAVHLTGADDQARAEQFAAISDDLDVPGVTAQIGGREATLADFNSQTEADIITAEMIATPVLTVLVILIFGSLVAATTPLLIGLLAVLGGFTVTRLLTYVTDVSVFAINVITIIGLGLAIDYSLFVVNRFREELAAGSEKRVAVSRTMATAGRTVLVSGLTVMLSLAGLLLFPLPFLHGIAFGGMAAVGIAVLGALTILPAVLVILGKRIDSLRVRGRRRGRHQGEWGAGERGVWARIGRAVMRRPILYLAGVLAILAFAASPFLHASFETVDERVLPEGTESRVVAERIEADFPGGDEGTLLVLVDGGGAAATEAVRVRIEGMDHVASVTPAAENAGSALLRVRSTGGEQGPETRALAGQLRELTPPEGSELHVAGLAAQVNDQLDEIAAGLPRLALFVVGVTLVLLFLAFGSILMPIKAVLMNLVSIGASFGAVVWAFQDGHLAGVLGFTARPLEASNLILILVLLFGLATDYEVFLLSRTREEWDVTGDNARSMMVGLQRTGGIITAAALLLIVVVAAFTTGQISFLKLIGIGMVVAIFVDATLVRLVLVPATMTLLGRANWWAPGPLRRLYARYGIREVSRAPMSVPVRPASIPADVP
jgi:trehalose monomycolate/heme transporter